MPQVLGGKEHRAGNARSAGPEIPTYNDWRIQG
jgi:hypothetical protein